MTQETLENEARKILDDFCTTYTEKDVERLSNELKNYYDSFNKKPRKKPTTSSLDQNQKIFITESGREELFDYIYRKEMNLLPGETIDDLYSFTFSAELLEDYCVGKTSLCDNAYNHISRLLKKEYEEWKKNK